MPPDTVRAPRRSTSMPARDGRCAAWFSPLCLPLRPLRWEKNVLTAEDAEVRRERQKALLVRLRWPRALRTQPVEPFDNFGLVRAAFQNALVECRGTVGTLQCLVDQS